MKQILLFLTLFLPAVVANAQKEQNSRLDILKRFNFWSLSGNSNARSSSKLGTRNAVSFGLFTKTFKECELPAT